MRDKVTIASNGPVGVFEEPVESLHTVEAQLTGADAKVRVVGLDVNLGNQIFG